MLRIAKGARLVSKKLRLEAGYSSLRILGWKTKSAMTTLKHYAVSQKSAVIVVAGRLDARGCQAIEMPLWNIIQGYPSINIVLDLTHVDYLSSYAVGFLVEACGTVMEYGGKMSISSPQPQVYETLYLNGADMVIPIYDSYQSALADTQLWY